jgi:microcystin-dependent protein
MNDSSYIGSIFIFTGTFAPTGWAFCDGSLLSIAENTALFSLLGTTYGGDGQTNFALPDLRGAAALGVGQLRGSSSDYTEGQTGGQEFVTLTQAQMPAHTHTVNMPVTESAPTLDTPGGHILASQNVAFYAPSTAVDSSYGGTSCTNTGGSQAIDIRSPYLAINYVICLYGIYPPRS